MDLKKKGRPQKVRPTFYILIFVAALLSFGGAALGQSLAQPEQFIPQPRRPRIEIGAAAGFFYLPDYPGADESHSRILPVPYFIYRGNVVRAEREGGIRTRFYRAEKFEFDLSFDAAFPVNSAQNNARQGMEDLDWIGEIGPRFIYHIFDTPKMKLDFYLPLRVVASTDFTRVDNRGAVVNPEFAFRRRALGRDDVAIAAYLGMTIASQRLMDYFYTIDAQYATPTRPQYRAEPGELATNASVFLVKELPHKITLFAGNSWNFYGNAKNRLSPLLRDRETVSYSLGVVWRFYESDEREGDDDANLSRD